MSNPESPSSGRLRESRAPFAVLSAAGVAALAALVLVTSAGVRLSAQPSATPVLNWLVGGTVTTTARVGDTLFVGGAFSMVAPDSTRVGTLVTVSATTGAIVTTYPRYDDALISIPDSTGGFYALIDVDLDGTFVRDIIHVRADGSRDPAFTFGAMVKGGTGSSFPGMRIAGTQLIVTHQVQVGGVDRAMVAVDLATGALIPWTPSLPANSLVTDLEASATRLFVMSYLNAGGRDVRAFDLATGAVLWQQTLPGQQTLAASGAMTLAGSRLIVGIDRVHALDAVTGVVDANWGGADDAPIWGVAASSTTVYVHGLFTTFRGQPRNHMVALDLARRAAAVESAARAAPPVGQHLALGHGVRELRSRADADWRADAQFAGGARHERRRHRMDAGRGGIHWRRVAEWRDALRA